ncbi:cation/H(+) antiporter 15 [Elaeis guineensis]|uniref:Cation/H(+) antiporter 15 n=1 Tax=Elaeis guineensis var. tenera TaxID=51953 RepID=A0A6I9RBB3_ELAGV|nr:cation/H(+) antiporter 15 [Elaeis guineensis]
MESANLTDRVRLAIASGVGGGVVCYSPTLITTNGIWKGSNPLEYSLPLFIIQVILVVVTTRVLVILLKPLHQPRVVAEIIGGILLGPSCLGSVKIMGESLFPIRSLLTLETVAHIGLLFFLFLVGVEMDVMVIKRTGRRALVIAVAGMVVPFGIGIVASYGLQRHVSRNIHQGSFLLFIGVALAVTAFPVLARILAESKLLNTEIGRIAMSSAIVNDMCAWILLALSIALSDNGRGGGKPNGNALASLWVLLSGVVFVLFCFYAVRPAMRWIMKRTPEGEGVSDFHVCLILSGVMLAGLTTDAIGIHSVFGAFVFGLVVPNGPLGVALIEKLEDFVTGLLLPLFFVISGLRTNLATVRDPKTVIALVVVFVLASVGKILGTVLIAVFFTMSFRDGLALGFLMNTRGLVEMIVLNIGRDKQVLDDESFAVMVVASVAMTALVTPVVMAVHRPTRRLIGYKRRNLQRSKPDVELRMMVCVHNTRNVPSLISLLDLSHPTKRSPIFVYALHLVELTARATAMLIVHSAHSSSSAGGGRAHSDHIFAGFESYEQHAGGVSVQTITTVSTYGSMHEDVCALAEDKHVTLIVLPFHKQQTVDGAMQPINPAIRTLNEGVLATAPCSVAVLVDRGLSAASRAAPAHTPTHHVALLFFGGPDDREALAYASRMVEHPGVKLLVIRFLPGDDPAASTSPSATAAATRDSRVITIVTDGSRQWQLDDECMNEFRLRNVSNESVAYTERVVNSSEDTVAALRAMESIHDLYIVGRGQGEATPMTAALAEWMECPELGPIGDLLASSDFSATVSVLVVQQYVGGALGPEVPAESADSPTGRAVPQYLNNANQRISVVAGTHRGAAPASFNVGWNGRQA